LTLALGRGERSTLLVGHFCREVTLDTHWIRDWVGLRVGLDMGCSTHSLSLYWLSCQVGIIMDFIQMELMII
jgi:hypothetical protein